MRALSGSPGHGAGSQARSARASALVLMLSTVLALLAGSVAPATAQTRAGVKAKRPDERVVKTLPPDLDHGVQEGYPAGRWAGAPPPHIAPAYHRDVVDAGSTFGILLPNAHVPQKRTFAYTNNLIFGHRVAYAPRHDLLLVGQAVVSPSFLGVATDWDTHGMLAVRWVPWRSQRVQLALSPQLMGRRGRRPTTDSSETGGALYVMADVVVHHRVVVGAGLVGYAPFSVRRDRYDTSACVTRDEYVARTCWRQEEVNTSFPGGGRWFGGWAHATFYAREHWHAKAELFSGYTQGTLWNVEEGIYGGNDPQTVEDRYTAAKLTPGAPDQVPLVLNLGVGWSNGTFGALASLLVAPPYRDHRDTERVRGEAPLVLPMLSLNLSL